ncbi:MAG TPA: hypothetical protein VMD02_04120 [Candidatus Omnitrophota bacterium]|nr:hypothetical protein [Candidatus Omnitrophota bacterium]
MADKSVSGSSSSRSAGHIGRMGAPVPAGLPPVLQRFWEFTKKNAQEFAKHMMKPEEHEKEFIEAVKRDFKHL